MENQVEFKTRVMGGFDKQSVLQYIYQMNQSARQMQEELRGQVEELGRARGQLGANLADMQGRMGILQERYDSALQELKGERSRTTELTGMIESLNAEIRKQDQIVQEKNRRIAELSDSGDRLENRNRELADRQKEVDRASAQIGKLMFAAQAEADKLMDEAREQAGEIVHNAHQTVSELHSQFGRFREEVALLQISLDEAVEGIRRKAGAIGEAIDQAESRLQEPALVSLVQVVESSGDQSVEDSLEQQETDQADQDYFFQVAAER